MSPDEMDLEQAVEWLDRLGDEGGPAREDRAARQERDEHSATTLREW